MYLLFGDYYFMCNGRFSMIKLIIQLTKPSVSTVTTYFCNLHSICKFIDKMLENKHYH